MSINPNTATKFTAEIFRKMLMQNIRAYQLTDHTWSVPSASQESKAYLVTAHYQRGVLVTTCTCEAGKAKKACKHQLKIVHETQRDSRILMALMGQSERKAA